MRTRTLPALKLETTQEMRPFVRGLAARAKPETERPNARTVLANETRFGNRYGMTELAHINNVVISDLPPYEWSGSFTEQHMAGPKGTRELE